MEDADTREPGEPEGVVAGYRPVSPLAVSAALLGVASTLALVSPLFWVVPIVAAAVSAAALADVGRRHAPKAGRLAALAGLALAIGCGAQAVAAAAAAEWLARGRAAAAAEFWLDTIAAGRLDDARSMCDHAVVAAVDRVAACGVAAPIRARFQGRHPELGDRVVRAVVGNCEFDVLIRALAQERGPGPVPFIVAGCDAVTPTAR